MLRGMELCKGSFALSQGSAEDNRVSRYVIQSPLGGGDGLASMGGYRLNLGCCHTISGLSLGSIGGYWVPPCLVQGPWG